MILKFSGNANNGSSDGAFYLNMNNDSANSNVNIGSGILLNNIINTICPHQQREIHNHTPLCVGRDIEDSGVTRH